MDWNLVEKNIKLEIDFLKNHIDLSPFSHNDPIKCSDCLFRLIASLLVSGKIKVKLIRYQSDSFWSKNSLILEENNNKNHGAFWHSSKIKLIKTYFEVNGFNVHDESQMFFGRCDLSIPELKVFGEVGTINIYKLYLNLLNMKDGKIILVTSDNSLLEFSL
jgi:hypothetical protein